MKLLTSGTILFIAIALFAGCMKDEKCGYDDCAIVAPPAEVQQVESYLSSNSIIATKHCSGMYYKVEQSGSGSIPSACKSVSVKYEGKLTNGNTFDKATSPVDFPLTQVITGFRNGLPLIRTGGRIILYVPPSLGYGNNQAGSIPPNSILIFSIDLVAVQ